MSRREADREDLYDEFRSARCKWELEVPGCSHAVILGIRKDDRFSIYFGQDPCYHFNTEDQLLRAYAGGFLYRTQGQTLARLNRQRTDSETALMRHDLTMSELAEFLSSLESNVQWLSSQLERRQYAIVRSQGDVNEFESVCHRLTRLASRHPQQLAPPFPTRRT